MNARVLPSINHIGITVTSIFDTIEFYKKFTDVEIFEKPTRIRGEGVGDVICVSSPDYDSCMVRIGNQSLELIEHHSSKGVHIIANHNDVGGVHLAFMVQDITLAFGAITAMGIKTTTNEPYDALELDGYKSFFFRDINGIQVEVGEVY